MANNFEFIEQVVAILKTPGNTVSTFKNQFDAFGNGEINKDKLIEALYSTAELINSITDTFRTTLPAGAPQVTLGVKLANNILKGLMGSETI